MSKNEQMIFNVIQANPFITLNDIAKELEKQDYYITRQRLVCIIAKMVVPDYLIKKTIRYVHEFDDIKTVYYTKNERWCTL